MLTGTTTPTKRDLARLALMELADYMHSAPTPDTAPNFDRWYTADELLQAALSVEYGQRSYMTDVVPDPTAEDGHIDYCMVCAGDPHGANCPVGMLEALAEVGLDSDTPVPAHLGLRSLTR